MKLALIGLLAVGFATPVLAQAGPGPTVSPVQVDKPEQPRPVEGIKKGSMNDPERIVCKREHVVGSNRPQKICMTVAQRDLLKDQVDQLTDPGRRTAGTKEDFGYKDTPK
ncbi:MAG: hypothetical protein JWR84_3193 [Caulobacter sp.]|nr:hypothetical protein [Caulobacter sp.]